MAALEEKELTPFQQSLKIIDHERRLVGLENDMKNIKPIVYETATSVKQIEKSVDQMTKNSNQIKMYFLAAVISGAVGFVYFAVQTLINN